MISIGECDFLGTCISYTRTEVTYRRKILFCPRRLEFTWQAWPCSMWLAWRQEQEAETSPLEQQAQSRQQTWSHERILALKVYTWWHTSSTKSTPKLSQMAPPAGEQEFIYRSLWGTFLFKPLMTPNLGAWRTVSYPNFLFWKWKRGHFPWRVKEDGVFTGEGWTLYM